MSKKFWNEEEVERLVKLRLEEKTWVEISAKFPGSTPNMVRKAYYRHTRDSVKATPVKILCFDIETSPILAYCWGLFDQNISLDQIVEDWSVLSWAAKWVGSKEVMYEDVSAQKNFRDDRKLLKSIWKLLDEADIVLTQNGIKFDVKKLNARFILNGMNPPSSFRHIDTLRIAKKHFSFTSNKLAFMTDKLCTKYIKSGHKQFPGFSLWSECLKGNKEAFKEMKDYNTLDVLALEELYTDHLRKWDKTLNLNAYHDDEQLVCSCGSIEFEKKGFVHSNLGRYQRYICKTCGKEHVDRTNLLTKEKRASLKK